MHVDTSFLVDLLREAKRGGTGPAHRLLDQLPADGSMTASVFVLCELEVGVRLAAQSTKEKQAVARLQRGLRVMYPDSSFPEYYAAIFASLERGGARVGVMDVAIAALAVQEKAPLVTGNAKHFSRIPGLELVTYRPGR